MPEVSHPATVTAIGTGRDRTRGFTLIEVMVVVAILGVLAALAGPSFREQIERWRVRQAVESLMSTLYLARSEAIKRGGTIVVRKNPAETGCEASTNQNWGCGWFVFVDTNGNGARSSDEEILQTVPPMPAVNVQNTLGGGGGLAFFRIDRWGQMNGLNAASFFVNPEPTGVSSPATTVVCVSGGGRIKASPGVTCS